MNAHNGFSSETFWKEQIISKLNGICDREQISEYDKAEHKNNMYWSDFIYVYDKKNDKVLIIKWVDLSNYNMVEKALNNEDFEVFCYSVNRTWTTYKSYKPVGRSFILQHKAKIADILDLDKN